MPSTLREWFAFFAPPICPFCRKDEVEAERGACPECEAALQWLEPPWCDACGLPLDAGDALSGDPGEDEDALCADCLAMPLPLRRARAAVVYGPLVQKAVARMKYGRDDALATALADTLLHLVPEYVDPLAYDWVTGIPLHRDRLRWRGFNQALLLARPLGRRFRIPWSPDLVVRGRATAVQAGLDRTERLRNLADAFVVPRPERVQGRTILLVDDVMTTGMTLAACAQALRDAGAAAVDAVTLARTLAGRGP